MKKLIPLFLFTPLLCLFGSPFGDITVNDLEKAIKEKKVAILDVNGAGSYRRGMFPEPLSSLLINPTWHPCYPKINQLLWLHIAGDQVAVPT